MVAHEKYALVVVNEAENELPLRIMKTCVSEDGRVGFETTQCSAHICAIHTSAGAGMSTSKFNSRMIFYAGATRSLSVAALHHAGLCALGRTNVTWFLLRPPFTAVSHLQSYAIFLCSCLRRRCEGFWHVKGGAEVRAKSIRKQEKWGWPGQRHLFRPRRTRAAHEGEVSHAPRPRALSVGADVVRRSLLSAAEALAAI